MPLTPDEILDREFTKKGSRAYIATEVDAFLDEINDDYKSIIADRNKLAKENDALKATVAELESKRDQVNQSIFVAQEAAERLKADADAEVKKQLLHAQESATKIISDARTKAEAEAIKLAKENADLIQEQNELRTEVENFKNSFLKLLTQQRTLLENDELAEAVHRLPMGQVTAERIEKQESTPVEETVVPDVQENVPEEGPVVVLPEAETELENKA